MALPLIGFIGLLLLAITLYFIGLSKTEANVNVGFAFVILASIILFSTSFFIMNEGLQLNYQNSVNPDTGEISWATVLYDVNSWNWLRVITDTIFYGAFVGIIIGAWKAYNTSRNNQRSEWLLD